MLVHRLRRWTSIKTALGESLPERGRDEDGVVFINKSEISTTSYRWWTYVEPAAPVQAPQTWPDVKHRGMSNKKELIEKHSNSSISVQDRIRTKTYCY